MKTVPKGSSFFLLFLFLILAISENLRLQTLNVEPVDVLPRAGLDVKRDYTPFEEFRDEVGAVKFKGEWIRGRWARESLLLKADDCLRRVKLSDDPAIYSEDCGPCRHCSGQEYFATSFREENIFQSKTPIEIDLENSEGRAGFLSPELRPNVRVALSASTVMALGLYWVQRIQIVMPWRFPIALASMAAGYLYFKATDLFRRQHDLYGHQEYLEFVERRGLVMPPVDAGFEFHQAPLYYWVVGGFAKAIGLQSLDKDLFAQSMSFSFFLLVVLLWYALWPKFFSMRGFFLDRGVFAAFLLLPSFHFLNARINNDTLGPLFGLGVFALYGRYRERRDFGWASVLGIMLAAAMMTKLNLVSLIGAVAAVEICALWADRKAGIRRNLFRLGLLLLPATAGLSFLLLRSLIQTGHLTFLPELQAELMLGNGLSHYLFFNPWQFLTAPGLNTWGGGVREHFFESVLVSFVSGEYEFSTVPLFLQGLARLMVLGMFGLSIWGGARAIRHQGAERKVVALAWFLGFLLLAYHRFRQPAACNQDARFLAPVFPAFILSFGYGLQALCGKLNAVSDGNPKDEKSTKTVPRL